MLHKKLCEYCAYQIWKTQTYTCVKSEKSEIILDMTCEEMLNCKLFKKYKALSFFGILLFISIVILFVVFKEYFHRFLFPAQHFTDNLNINKTKSLQNE